jgi:hypothetical protein
VAQIAGRAVRVGAWEKGRGSWKLNVDWRLRRIIVGRWGDGLHGAILVDGRWHRVGHDGRVSDRPGTGRSDRVGTLAAVAPMRQLVVVKTASQLSLFQVSGNVFVRHLLEASLEKVNFLKCCVSLESEHREHIYSYLILAPSSSTASGCLLSVLLNTEIVTVNGIDWRVVGRGHMGRSVHLVRW